MVICPKCQVSNPPDRTICQNCGSDLLPGETLKDRLATLIIGIIACVIGGLIAYFLIRNPEITESSEICLLSDPIAWAFASVFSLISAIVTTIRKTPEFQKYENRAKRHIDLYPEQAVSDYTKAIELAPAKQKAALIKARAELFMKIGREEESIKDKLEYMTAEGSYDDAASFVRLFGGDKDAYIDQTIKDERKRLISEGKIKGVAFCTKCQRAVELNENLKCPLHPRTKLLKATFVMPADVDQTLQNIDRSAGEEWKKTRKRRLIVWIVIAVLLVVCVLIPILMNAVFGT